MKIHAIIERGTDGLYSIYLEEMLLNYGLGGFGSSIEEAKADFFVSIEEAKEMIIEEGKKLPDGADNIDVVFKCDF